MYVTKKINISTPPKKYQVILNVKYNFKNKIIIFLFKKILVGNYFYFSFSTLFALWKVKVFKLSLYFLFFYLLNIQAANLLVICFPSHITQRNRACEYANISLYFSSLLTCLLHSAFSILRAPSAVLTILMINSSKGGLNCKEVPGTQPESRHSLRCRYSIERHVLWGISIILLKDSLEAPALSASGGPWQQVGR